MVTCTINLGGGGSFGKGETLQDAMLKCATVFLNDWSSYYRLYGQDFLFFDKTNEKHYRIVMPELTGKVKTHKGKGYKNLLSNAVNAGIAAGDVDPFDF